MKKYQHCLGFFVAIICIGFTKPASADMSGQCPDSEYFQNLTTDICWGCMIPISLFGLTDPPDGANEDFNCACNNELDIPVPGFSVGFFQPDQIMEVSSVPWCSPTLGGVQLSSDYTHLGSSIQGQGQNDIEGGGEIIDTASEALPMVQLHYNYLASPIMKMMQVLAIPECDKSPGIVDLDIMFMSPLTPEWTDDLLSFVINPDAVAFANPIGQAVCVADCVDIMATGNGSEDRWYCAGCDGGLYPLTGNVAGSADNPIQSASLVTQRAIAKAHRIGTSPKTMGKDAMCSYVYAPMMPKSQYKMQLAFPSPDADGTCCHPMGENWLKYGLGRISPGGGKDTTLVFNIFRYSDCCIPWL